MIIKRKNKYALLFGIIFFINIVIINVYFIKIYNFNKKYKELFDVDQDVALRKFPYPYKAAVAICSDIDNTETIEEFLEIQKFLNTDLETSLGKGIKLEIGNSFFFYEPPLEAISFLQSNDKAISDNFIRLIKAGYVDVLHSFGKKRDFKREDAIVALKLLKKNNCKIDVWVDHTISQDNFGDDVTSGFGDHLNTKHYHADLTLKFGIKFVWLGRVTSIAGQACPISIQCFKEIFELEYPIKTFVNMCKELGKNVLGVFGSNKYKMHQANDLIIPTVLDDGQKIYEFIRFDNHWNGVGRGANAKGLAHSISKKTINNIKARGGYSIVYTHLGKNVDCSKYLPETTKNALLNLADENRQGNVYVTTTSKLLNYYIAYKYLRWKSEIKDGITSIYILDISDPVFGNYIPKLAELQGITFYVPDKRSVRIFIGKKEVVNYHRNKPDSSGRESVTLPFTKLKYPL